MKTEKISAISFGMRPDLRVSPKYKNLLNLVADKFDVYNCALNRNPNDAGYYEIVQNSKGLIFTEYKEGFEHRIKFGRKLSQEFLEKPADYIAKTLAKAAEIFALDDKLWGKASKFVDSIAKEKQLKMSEKRIGEFSDNLLDDIYNKYILTALKDNLKENGFMARAKIEL